MRYVRTFNQVQYSETDVYGGRACDLALLRAERVAAPEGFVLTADAWESFFKDIRYKSDFILQQVSLDNERTLANAYNSIRKLILNTQFPDEVLAELRDSYESLGVGLESMDAKEPFVTLVTSPTYVAEAESFEGIVQNVRGFDQLLVALKELYAMAYTPEAIKYRAGLGVKRFAQAVIVEAMPTAVASATAYSTDPEQRDKIFVHTYKGYTDLRDIVAKDFFHVRKEYLTVEGSQVVEQSKIIVREDDGSLAPVECNDRGQSLNDKQVMEVARLAKKSEKALGNPVKIFVAVTGDEQYVLLFANRYALPEREELVKPAPEAGPAAAAAGAASSPEMPVEESSGESSAEQGEEVSVEPAAEEPVEEPDDEPAGDEYVDLDEVEDELEFDERETGDEVEEAEGPDEGAELDEEPAQYDAEPDEEVPDEEPEEYADDEGAEESATEDDEEPEGEEPDEDGEYDEDADEEPEGEDEYEDDESGGEYEEPDDGVDDEEDVDDEEADEYDEDSAEDDYEDESGEEPDEDGEYDEESSDEPDDDDEYEEDDSEDDDHESDEGAEYDEDADEEPEGEDEDVDDEIDVEDESGEDDEFILDESELTDEDETSEGSAPEKDSDMINRSCRLIYSELAKRYEQSGEQAPDTLTELIQQGTQKGVFDIEGLSDVLAIKRKARSGEEITEDERHVVLSIVDQLMD